MTREEIRIKALDYETHHLFNTRERCVDALVDFAMSLQTQLPTDEEIKTASQEYADTLFLQETFYEGAWWMREQLKHKPKSKPKQVGGAFIRVKSKDEKHCSNCVFGEGRNGNMPPCSECLLGAGTIGVFWKPMKDNH